MRYHRMVKGRIVASGPDPEALDGEGMVFSDRQWRDAQFIRALRDVAPSFAGKMEPWRTP